MISKEQFRLIVAGVVLSTGKSQEELAIGMGYGKNYISEVLSPTGKLSEKFVAAFKHQYAVGSENPKWNDSPLSRTELSELIKTNRLQAEAILDLTRKVSFGVNEKVSPPGRRVNKDKRGGISDAGLSDKM